MSLRVRLVLLVAVILVISLAVGGAATCLNASRSVRTEMRSAMMVARQTVENGLNGLPGAADPQRALDDLVASFNGNRHLRVSVTSDPEANAVPVSDHSPFGRVPAWFIRLVDVNSVVDRVPVAIGGRPHGAVVIETVPTNEIIETWNQASEGLLVLTLFCGQTILLIYLFIGRALRPLDRLAAGLERVGQGDYGIRIGGRPTPELARLQGSFNRMAARLAEIDADNHRLTEQLLTLRERERGDIARDLHDEISPFLFAINVDIANIARLAKEHGMAELGSHIQSAADAVRHMQRQVKGLLARLRPIGIGEFGLAGAIDGLTAFWRRRHPEIEWLVGIAPDCENLGDVIETAVYRVVQESVSNALRHGKPGRIAVSIGCTGDEVIVEVADNGRGMLEAATAGYGLIGMEERIRAIGGRLIFGNRPGGGFGVTATLPRSDEPAGRPIRFQDATG